MLELKEIVKAYQTASLVQVALNKVSVAFRDNEFVAVLGQSGSGKTTMLNVIGGLDRFQAGDLVIDGISTKDYKARDWDAYRNNRIGFVFQAYNLIPHQSVLANVELALTLSGVSRSERRKRALDALERVGLKDHVNKKPSQMSGGQMQRVAIARALINDPEILLADEPTGALDSATSVQVMDLLRDVARDRLVIMVTHNPELAHQYATRIVELADGCIVADSDPFVPTAEDQRAAKPARRTSMGFVTALSLSANNLMTKKGRTLMTSFVGSIGIIGIAAILALANGTNAYIQKTEEETLGSYPLTIQKSGVDMTAALSVSASDSKKDKPAPDGQVGVSQMRTFADTIRDAKTNDLASLKTYLDNNGGNVETMVNAIEYDYDVVPQIFQSDTSKATVQVSPDQSMKQMEAGFGSGAFGSMMQTNAFYQMPATASLYTSAYDLVAGSWPSGANQVVLVLDEDGNIPNLFEYTLGLKDHKEFDDLMRTYYQGTLGGKTQSGAQTSAQSGTSDATYDYSTILSTTFRRINAFDKYTWDETYKVWTDRSNDADYMKKLVDDGQELTISGIVKPNSDKGGALRQGIAYTPALTYQIIEEASASPIVKAQRAKPDVDVFTGKTFKELADDQKSQSTGFDMSSLFTVDESKLSAAFQIDPDKMQMDLSGMDFSGMDLSGIDFSTLDMSGLDLSNLDLSTIDFSNLAGQSGAQSGMGIDLSTLDLGDLTKDIPELATIDFPTIIQSALADGAVKDGAGEYLSAQASEIAQGFQEYAQKQIEEGGTTDFAVLAANYFSQPEVLEKIQTAVGSDQVVDADKLSANLMKAIGDDPALAKIGTDISTQVMNAISTQIAAQLGASLTQGVGAAIGQVMQEAMTAAMTQMMTQISDTIGTQMNTVMDQFATDISSAFSMDPNAFAEAFKSNVDEKSLAALMATMFSTNVPSLETNLRNLGWADIASPSNISIYPKSFADKDKVKAALDTYNKDNEAAGATDKVITYSDIMGALMSSVTTIVDIISWLLIAFVSISLVVSSIMISIITYISVLERRKEIGILRSIGASKGDVSRVFNAETVIEGFLAGTIGVGVTYALCALANSIAYSSFNVENIAQLSPLTAVALVAVSVGLTVIAGIIPAARASRQDPVEALRSE
ncbi:ATP-binding cassette domain-containing protein [Actinomyces sp. ICM47]|uniref:ATP-binding cassette domain-containing protein n=1 Tax=Actinomyces sp. ICM47 TaxID=936548 RepID=UPI0025C57D8F|nr:ATP-binding cassette domain-containing protein [Actinomyces sp. ICM47]